MKNKAFTILVVLGLATLISCSQNNTTVEDVKVEKPTEPTVSIEKQSHNYGGWYCPDNLNGFPAVDIINWKNVPVVNGRMPTKEETQNGTSLIFVDHNEYPNAKPLDMKMPQLARFYNYSSQKEEIIIVIQAIKILDDSIVGFRYLNGGNGSSHLSEVTILSENEIKNLTPSNFVSLNMNINATQSKIWEIITYPGYTEKLQPIFDPKNTLNAEWRETSKVNFKYPKANTVTAKYGDNLYGNQYIQMDFEMGDYQYVEKFLLIENQDTHTTELQIVCGPYREDFEEQQSILKNWAKKVKELSEKE